MALRAAKVEKLIPEVVADVIETITLLFVIQFKGPESFSSGPCIPDDLSRTRFHARGNAASLSFKNKKKIN